MADRLRLGVAGLGRAFMLMLPTFTRHPAVALVAAADPRAEARAAFARDFGGSTYDTVDALAGNPDIDAIYIATPHQFHVAHVEAAARGGKHLLVEKPMALTIADCDRMIAAADRAGVVLLVGHSHSFDAPYLTAAAMIASGDYGAVRMITAVNYTDFLYRPRRPEELVTAEGGGVIFSQGAHQVDVVRLLGGGLVAKVRAVTGNWDQARSTEGTYQALLTFESGASASLTYSGYGRFDTDEMMGWVSEMGHRRNPDIYGGARAALRKLATPGDETALKRDRSYGVVPLRPDATLPTAHNHFGVVIASCERADLRPIADGVHVYEDAVRVHHRQPAPAIPRAEVVDELYAAIRQGRQPLHSGSWGRATLEVCLGILTSARTGQEVSMSRQVKGV